MKYEVTFENLKWAFIKLKSHYYYNNDPLFMKEKIVNYEKNLKNNLLNLVHRYSNNELDDIITSIKCAIIPKKESSIKSNDGLIISRVNHFIDAPIEFHLLDILWIINIVSIFPSDFNNRYVYGNKLNDCFFNMNINCLANRFLFDNYNKLYNEWRNNCFRIASLVNRTQNIDIINIDLKRYYYNKIMNFTNIESKYGKCNDATLNLFIKRAYCFYDRFVNESGPYEKRKSMLIIGAISSAVFANLLLKDFDKEIISDEDVVYYGRYVDDILIVKKSKSSRGICSYQKNEALNYFCNDSINCIQQKKVISSFYGGKIELSINIDKVWCYHFNQNKYDDSSLKYEIKEKIFCSNELTISNSDVDNYGELMLGHNNLKELRNLLYNNNKKIHNYKSKIDKLIFQIQEEENLINYRTIWKDIFCYLYEQKEDIQDFYNKCQQSIMKINQVDVKQNYRGNVINEKYLEDIKESLKKELNVAKEFANDDGIYSLYRYNSLKSHQIIQYIKSELFSVKKFGVCLYDLYPFNFKYEEILPIALLENQLFSFDYVEKLCLNVFELINGYSYNKKYKHKEEKFMCTNLITFESLNDVKKEEDQILIAIANMNYSKSDVIDSIINGTPIFPTQEINYIIDEAIKKKANYIIFPEFCINYYQFMDIQKMAKGNISIISGITSVVDQGKVHNYIWLYNHNINLSLLREKNYYAPEEILIYLKNGIECHNPIPKYYIINDRIIRYSEFLCFEATNIVDRAIMKGKVDVVFLPVLNKDTNYFSSILTSFSRDISAYLVQSNINKLGDSGIYAPYKTNYSTILKTKGGNNNYLSVEKINLNQVKKYREYEAEVDMIVNSFDDSQKKYDAIKQKMIDYKIKCEKDDEHKDLLISKPSSATNM